MNTLQFSAELAHALGWPISVLAIVVFVGLVFRKAIILLIDRIKTLSGGGFSAEFDARLTRAEEIDIPDVPLEDTRTEFAHLNAVAQVDPNALVKTAWLKVEEEMTYSLAALGRPTKKRYKGLEPQIRSLNLLSSEQLRLLAELRSLYRIVRTNTTLQVSAVQAEQYAQLAESLVAQLRVKVINSH